MTATKNLLIHLPNGSAILARVVERIHIHHGSFESCKPSVIISGKDWSIQTSFESDEDATAALKSFVATWSDALSGAVVEDLEAADRDRLADALTQLSETFPNRSNP